MARRRRGQIPGRPIARLRAPRQNALAPLNPVKPFHAPRAGSAGGPPPRRRRFAPGMHGRSMWPSRKLLSRHAFGLQAVPVEDED
jgi:hypothetical protein